MNAAGGIKQKKLKQKKIMHEINLFKNFKYFKNKNNYLYNFNKLY